MFSIDNEGVLWFKDRLVVPKVLELRQSILKEAHATRLPIHPGSNKMYHDLKQKVLVDQNEDRNCKIYSKV